MDENAAAVIFVWAHVWPLFVEKYTPVYPVLAAVVEATA
jgi:hypothetical protein